VANITGVSWRENIYSDGPFFFLHYRQNRFFLIIVGRKTNTSSPVYASNYVLSFSNINSFYYFFCPLTFVDSFSWNKNFDVYFLYIIHYLINSVCTGIYLHFFFFNIYIYLIMISKQEILI